MAAGIIQALNSSRHLLLASVLRDLAGVKISCTSCLSSYDLRISSGYRYVNLCETVLCITSVVWQEDIAIQFEWKNLVH